MKKFLLASVSAIALTSSVRAADLPVKAPAPPPLPPVVWSWAGPYIGIHGGIVSHRGKLEDDGLLAGVENSLSTHSVTKTGGIFGGHAGYNLQSGAIVYGIEGT